MQFESCVWLEKGVAAQKCQGNAVLDLETRPQGLERLLSHEMEMQLG